MAKRFTETGKWSDPWYRALSPTSKLGWTYLLDNCDTAGVIDLDRPLADFQVGESVDWDGLIDGSDGRIERLSGGKLWVVGFIDFQYGKLSEECNAHKPVLASLQKHCIKLRVPEGYLKGTQRVQDKDKDKDKDQDKDKDKEKEGGAGETNFSEWWSTVPNKVGKQAAEKAYRNAVRLIRGRSPDDGAGGDDPCGFLLERMKAFADSPKASGGYCPHPTTWLKDGRYDDDPETWQDSGKPQNGRRDHIGAGQRYDSSTETRHSANGWE